MNPTIGLEKYIWIKMTLPVNTVLNCPVDDAKAKKKWDRVLGGMIFTVRRFGIEEVVCIMARLNNMTIHAADYFFMANPLSTPASGSTAPTSRLNRIVARIPWPVFWALTAQAILSITRFFSKMVVGGRIEGGSAAELAYFDAAFGVLMLVVGVHEAFVTTPLTFFNHRQEKANEKKFAGTMLLISLLFSLVAVVVLAVVVGYRYTTQGVSSGLLLAMAVLTVMVPFQIVREFSRRWLLANLQVRQSALLEIVFASFFVALLFALVMMQQVSAAMVFGITAVANLLCLCGWWYIYRKQFSVALDGFRRQVRQNFQYGKWIACENMCSVAMLYFSQWFLIAKLGETGAGVYSACLTIVLLANPFMLGVASLFAPRAAQEFSKNQWRGLFWMLMSYGTFVVSVLAVFCVGLYFFGGQLTTVFFGDKYEEFFANYSDGQNTITFLLGLAMPCFGLSFLLTCCLLAVDVPIYSFFAAVVGLVTTMAVNLSCAEPTLYTAAVAFVLGAFATMSTRVVLVGWAYLHQAGQPA